VLPRFRGDPRRRVQCRRPGVLAGAGDPDRTVQSLAGPTTRYTAGRGPGAAGTGRAPDPTAPPRARTRQRRRRHTGAIDPALIRRSVALTQLVVDLLAFGAHR